MAVVKAKEREKAQEISFEDVRKGMSFVKDSFKKENKWLIYRAVYNHMLILKEKMGLSQEAFNEYTIRFKNEIYDDTFIKLLELISQASQKK